MQREAERRPRVPLHASRIDGSGRYSTPPLPRSVLKSPTTHTPSLQPLCGGNEHFAQPTARRQDLPARRQDLPALRATRGDASPPRMAQLSDPSAGGSGGGGGGGGGGGNPRARRRKRGGGAPAATESADISYLSDRPGHGSASVPWRQAFLDFKVPPTLIPPRDHVVVKAPIPAPRPAKLHSSRNHGDGTWLTTLFPSTVPASRHEVEMLRAWLDASLSNFVGARQVAATPPAADGGGGGGDDGGGGGAAPPAMAPAAAAATAAADGKPASSEGAESADVMGGIFQIYSVAVNEIVRQASVHCVERGQLLETVWRSTSSMVGTLLAGARSAEDRLDALRQSQAGDVGKWMAAHAQLAQELEAARDSRDEMETKAQEALAGQRQLQAEQRRVAQLTREKETGVAERAALEEQLAAAQRRNARLEREVEDAAEAAEEYRAAARQAERTLAAAQADARDERKRADAAEEKLRAAEERAGGAGAAREHEDARTPRPDWPALQAAAMEGGAPLRDLAAALGPRAGGSSAQVRALIGAYEEAAARLRRDGVRFGRLLGRTPTFRLGLGDGPGVPAPLRACGRVRVDALPFKAALAAVRAFWRAKREHDGAKPPHEREPADTFLELHLAARQSQSSWQPARQQAYALVEACRRHAYCADLATFLAILHAQLPEAAHAEQQAAVEALQREMSARGGGGTPLADVLDAAVCAVEPLRVVVLSEGRRLKALHEALAADLAEVDALKAAGEEPDQDDCDEVFAEDPEGNEGALVQMVRGLLLDDALAYLDELRLAAARIGERSNRTELTASQFVEAIMLVDETKEAASIADALSWGFGVAPGEEVARDERISPEEFFANLSRRGGAQRRSQPVRKLRSNIRIVSGFAAPADARR